MEGIIAKKKDYVFLFCLCLLSRLLTSLYAIRGPESLKYALGVSNAGDPVSALSTASDPLFTFSGRLLYQLCGECALTFSMVGGVSIFLIIIYILWMTGTPFRSFEGGLLTLLIFFNAPFWVMGNKFLPDLLGIALLVMACYHLLFEGKNGVSRSVAGPLLFGIILGVRPYLGLLLILPMMYAFVIKGNFFRRFAGLFTGIACWLIPEVLLMDNGTLFLLTGGVSYENVLAGGFDAEQTAAFFHALWTEGLGGFVPGRGWESLVVSLITAAAFFPGLLILLQDRSRLIKFRLLLCSCLIYALCLLWLGPPQLDFRYTAPLLPFFLVMVGYGMLYGLIHWNNLWVKAVCVVFMIAYGALTLKMVLTHRQPSAFNKLDAYISRQQGKGLSILAPADVRFYLAKQGISARFYPVEQREQVVRQEEGRVLCVCPQSLKVRGMQRDTCFRHPEYLSSSPHELVVYNNE